MSIEMATGSEMMDCDNSELITDRETVSEPHDAIDDEDQLEITQVYMTAVRDGGCIGVSYYRTDTMELYMMPDVDETDNFDILKKAYDQIQPTWIIFSTKDHERLSKVLVESVGKEFENQVKVLPSIDFDINTCKRRLNIIQLPSMPDTLSESDRLLHISTLIQFENFNMVRAVGSLLKYLEKHRVGVELEDARTKVPVLALRTFTLNDILLIDDNSYRYPTTRQYTMVFTALLTKYPFLREAGLGSGFLLHDISLRFQRDVDANLVRQLPIFVDKVIKVAPATKSGPLLEKLQSVVDAEDLENTQPPCEYLHVRALQIFKQDSHPSGFKFETGREGISLFGILNKCKSRVGSNLLRLWFKHPLRNLQLINDRQKAVRFFLDPANQELADAIQHNVKNIKNLAPILRRMMQSQCSMADWSALYRTVDSALTIGELCRRYEGLEIFENAQRLLNSKDLHGVRNLINTVVDFQESAMSHRLVVKPNINPELDEKKKLYESLPDMMTEIAEKELARLGSEINECKISYLPQIGYLLVIDMLERMRESQDYNLPGLDYMFSSNDVLHYKSQYTRDMDERFGDTFSDITDIETSIMHSLQNNILEKCDLLLNIVPILAELDCFMSLASCAHSNNYVQPTMITNCVINIKAGRHPNQELCCYLFIANDTHNGDEEDGSRIKFLTGANSSGKSVYLKQVGLIVFMAHIGSFVPAEFAEIGLVDQIFTRIQTMETISVQMSAFLIDLNQVSLATRLATTRSLVLLDEFGKGTDENDGAALLAACVNHFIGAGAQCPHTFVSTHFHVIHEARLLHASPLLKYQLMEVANVDGELAYLYHLKDGLTDASQAFNVASMAGLPDEILHRSTQVLDSLRKGIPLKPVNGPVSEIESRRYLKIVERFMSLDLDNPDLLRDFLQNFVIPLSKGDLDDTL